MPVALAPLVVCRQFPAFSLEVKLGCGRILFQIAHSKDRHDLQHKKHAEQGVENYILHVHRRLQRETKRDRPQLVRVQHKLEITRNLHQRRIRQKVAQEVVPLANPLVVQVVEVHGFKSYTLRLALLRDAPKGGPTAALHRGSTQTTEGAPSPVM